jgi:hypothetical protein
MIGASVDSPMVVGTQEHQEMPGFDSLDLYHLGLDVRNQYEQQHGLKVLTSSA